MSTLKIGYIGSGFIAKFLTVALKQVRNCELVAIYDRGGAMELVSYAKQNGLGSPKLYSSISELCNHCDAVAIFSPNFTCVEIMEEITVSVKNGASLKSAICEKPLSRDLQEARRMTKLARQANLNTAYFENQLFMNVVNNALEQLRPKIESMGNIALTRSTEEHAGPHSS